MSNNLSKEEEILETVLGTELSRTWLGVTRTANDDEKHSFLSDDINDSPAHKMLGVSYRIINTKHPGYKNLSKAGSRIRSVWIDSTLPWVKRGVRILNKKNYNSFHEEYNKYLESFNKIAEVFCTEVWPSLVDEAKEKWGSYFNPALYPLTLPLDTFSFSLGYPDLEEASSLEALDPARYAKQKALAASRIKVCCEAAEKAFSQGLQGILASLQEALTPGVDEQGNLVTKKVPTTTIKALNNFYKEFQTVSITDHHELDALFQKALALTNDIDFANIKTAPETAIDVKKSLADIASSIHLVTGAAPAPVPIRKLTLKKPQPKPKTESEECLQESCT